MSSRFPTAFVAHGSPMLATDPVKGADLRRWAQAMPRPASILVISAHWELDAPALGSTVPGTPLVYDFSGFPPELYRIKYAAPPAPALAERVRSLLQGEWGPVPATQRGLDHGAWVPLLHMYPEADVPVLQLALPSRHTYRMLLALGQALAPLRDEGVLILGSGVLVHNFSYISFDTTARPEEWAVAFEAWVQNALSQWDLDALVNVRTLAPGGREAIPSHEHFMPLLIPCGAALNSSVSYPIRGFEFGSLSRMCIEFSQG